MQMQMEDLLEKEAEVWEEKIVGIKKDYARRMKECEEQCQNETQSIIEMMNEKTSKEIKYERQKYNREKQQLGSKVLQYEESINEYIKENGKLGEAIKELRYQKEEMEGELRQLIAEKSSYNSKFALHQKELENIRNSNNEWEEVLKDKVREVNKEKQKLEEEICEIKVHYKNKLSKAKQESVRKMEDILTEKEKNSKQMLQ